jgi:LemA protein
MKGIYIVLIIIAVLALALIALFNNLVRLRQRVKNAWAQVDVQLKRRYDLIPNLVNTVKGYAEHEKSTFEKITRARAAAISAGTVQEQAKAENALTESLKSLFAVAESYPELKANTNFLQLQTELSDTENKISFARQFYNDIVQRFNTAIQVFPANIFAGMMGFKAAEYFSVEESAEKNPPEVKF